MSEDIIIDIVPVTGPPHVLVRESHPEQGQRCFIVLDISALTLSVEIDPEPWNNSVPAAVYYGYERRYTIPPLQPATANALMEKVLPLAATVAGGSLIDHDRLSRRWCRVNASGLRAHHAIEAMAEQVECDVSFWPDAAGYVDGERANILGMLRRGVSVDEVYHLIQGDGSDDAHYYVIGLRDQLERMAAEVDDQAPLGIVNTDSRRRIT